MKSPDSRLAVMPFLLFSLALSAQSVPPTAKSWTLSWSDEFNGTTLDASKWVYDIGGGKWGNKELEYYSDRPENVAVRDGSLAITARAEKIAGPDHVSWNYSSGRIKTLGKFSETYGRFEARMKLPAGQGMWPAFWMLGENIEKVGGQQCGEMDIMENLGKEPSIVYGTIHGPGYLGAGGLESHYTLPGGKRFSDDFHVFALEWEPDAIRFYVDDDLYVTRTPADIPPGKKWAFDHPFFLLLNLAVGGDWPGNPDASTTFPQTMLVDYVRVYRRAGR